MESDLKKRAARTSSTSQSRVKCIVDSGNSSCSLQNSHDKENANVNKSEALKLNMEPLPMKRKKKGVGYNLRKSLAWDRAFFTEEGVLDPLELSMICGTSFGDQLSVINEDTCGDSQCLTEPIDEQTLEKNLLDEVPDEALNRKTKKDSQTPKRDSAARITGANTPASVKKVLSTHHGGKSRPRYGGNLRPLPLSSLKRPANISASKVGTKELKLSKRPVSEPGISSVPRNAKKTTLKANHSKLNQIAQQDSRSQRNFGSRNPAQNLQNMQNRLKTGTLPLEVSSSRHHLQENSARLLMDVRSSISTCPQPFQKVGNSGAEDISHNVVPSSTVPSMCQKTSISGRNLQPSQIQSVKPSGLRMPSPSLGFFGQTNASTHQNVPWRNTDLNVPRSVKLGDSRLKETMSKISKMVKNTAARKTDSVSSRLGCLVPCSVNSVSCDTLKLNSIKNNKQKVEADTSTCNAEDKITSICGRIQDNYKRNKIERIVLQDDKRLLVKDKEQFVEIGSCGQATDNDSVTKSRNDFSGNSDPCVIGSVNSEFVSNGHHASFIPVGTSGTESVHVTVSGVWNSMHDICQQSGKIERDPFVESQQHGNGCTRNEDSKASKCLEQSPTNSYSVSGGENTENLEESPHADKVMDKVLPVNSQMSSVDIAVLAEVTTSELNSSSGKASEPLTVDDGRRLEDNMSTMEVIGYSFTKGDTIQNLLDDSHLKFRNDLLPIGSNSDKFGKSNALQDMSDVVVEKSIANRSDILNANVFPHESPLMHEIYDNADKDDCQPCIEDGNSNHLLVGHSNENTSNKISEDSMVPVDGKLHLDIPTKEDKVGISDIKKSEDAPKKESKIFVPPRDAVPFSDEWLAAMEAAGEDILSKKSGAVQNSPPEKSLPEPSPWSPVKRKNNQIGPYDCTKFTNVIPSDSH